MSRLFFAIFDKKAGLYDHVQAFRSEADAVRAVRSLVNSDSKGSLIAQYPSDYELFRLGDFDQLTGRFNDETPVFVVALGVLVDAGKAAANAEA